MSNSFSRLRKAGQEVAAGAGSRGGSFVPYMKYEKDVPARVRFVENLVEYDDGTSDYFKLDSHFIKRPRPGTNSKGFNMVCSSNYPPYAEKEGEEPYDWGGRCVTCAVSSTKDPAFGFIKGMRTTIPFQLIDMRLFHKIDTGERKDNGEPKYKWEQCDTQHQCASGECRQGHIKTIGGRRIMTFGPGHIQQLLGVNTTLGRTCINPGCSDGEIYIVGYNCESCGEFLLDPDAPNKLNPKDMMEFGDKVHQCKACGERGFPEEIIECTQCNDPRRGSIYDIDLEVVKTGEGLKSSYTFTPKGKFGPLGKQYAEELKPFDWFKMFHPEPLPEQAAALNVANPFEEDADHQTY